MEKTENIRIIAVVSAVVVGFIPAAASELSIIASAYFYNGPDNLARTFTFDIILLFILLMFIYLLAKIPFRLQTAGTLHHVADGAGYPYLVTWLLAFCASYFLFRYALISFVRPEGLPHHSGAFLALPFGLFAYFRFKRAYLPQQDKDEPHSAGTMRDE
jgi:hypothetical protein